MLSVQRAFCLKYRIQGRIDKAILCGTICSKNVDIIKLSRVWKELCYLIGQYHVVRFTHKTPLSYDLFLHSLICSFSCIRLSFLFFYYRATKPQRELRITLMNNNFKILFECTINLCHIKMIICVVSKQSIQKNN